VPPPLHVVLHRPEIPNNTGNIGRTCVAVGAAMHLIHPLGFELSERACRRAGLDYWARLDLHEHDSWEGYRARSGSARFWLFTTRCARPLFDARFEPGDHLVFGGETAGLPGPMLDAEPDRTLCLPMAPGERSLNLATVVCAAVYEGVRQMLERGEMALDGSGRLAPPET